MRKNIRNTLYRTTLYRTTLYRTTLYRTTLYRTTLYRTTLYRTTLYRTTLYRTTLYRTMWNQAKRGWEAFTEGRPGRRFRDRYRRRQQGRRSRFALGRLLYIAAGVVVMLVGVVLMPAPGPGWAIFFFGLGLLGSEFLVIARFMDRGEMRLRATGRWSRSAWQRAPLAGRAALVLLALTLAAATAAGLYWLAFRWGGL